MTLGRLPCGGIPGLGGGGGGGGGGTVAEAGKFPLEDWVGTDDDGVDAP